MPRPKAPSRFGMNEPAAGPIARASHRLNLVAGIVITLLPGLWTLVWNLVMWPAGLATLSNICLSLQLFALGLIVCAHWTTFNFCVYDPMRDWLEEYTVCGASHHAESFCAQRSPSRHFCMGRDSCSSTVDVREC
jgi:hypothetical protein